MDERFVGLCLSRECGLDVELWLRQQGNCKLLGEWRATARDYHQPVLPERSTIQNTQVEAERHGTDINELLEGSLTPEFSAIRLPAEAPGRVFLMREQATPWRITFPGCRPQQLQELPWTVREESFVFDGPELLLTTLEHTRLWQQRGRHPTILRGKEYSVDDGTFKVVLASDLALGIRRKMAPMWLLLVERRSEGSRGEVESLQEFVSEMLQEAGPAGQMDLEIQAHSCLRAVHERGSDTPSARQRLLALYIYSFIELAKEAGPLILPGSASVLLREQEAASAAGRNAQPTAALKPVSDAELKPVHLVTPPLPRASDCEFIKDFGFSVVASRPRPTATPPPASPQRPNGAQPSPLASPAPLLGATEAAGSSAEGSRGTGSDSSSMLWLLMLLLVLPAICVLVGLLSSRKRRNAARQVYVCAVCNRNFRLSVDTAQAGNLSNWVCRSCLYARSANRAHRAREREEVIAKRLEELREVEGKQVRLTRINTHFYRLRNSVVPQGRGEPVVEGQVAQVKPSAPEECLICLDGETPCDIVLLPCGHSGLCEACCEDIVCKHDGKCPVCRERIKMIARVKEKDLATEPATIGADDLEIGEIGNTTESSSTSDPQGKRGSVYLAEVIPCPDASVRIEAPP
ncbi:hypothetical protein FOL47_008450 [Perkinsus chesapeaki]|uniref:RING-type domain-containing protein n=1 Tax=Perkinsus chesapeaki TaxID=330153 RepID=A0A7J6LDV5_PERCH|nr:hypothetical protein FOL47_008450 [Perkinsus chesapeaki]